MAWPLQEHTPMVRWWGGLALAVGLTLASPAAHADDVDSYLGALMKPAEIRAAHPKLEQDPVYHDSGHSLTVPRAAWELAKARGLPLRQQQFLGQVGLVHDWDPDREPGMPARVDATLAVLEADWNGTKPLIAGARGSVLKERFGWTPAQYKTARALILRTQYPFDPKAAIRYERALKELGPGDRAFALREGALLSEFADKGSLYMTAGFMRVSSGTVGLAGEVTRVNATFGKGPMTVLGLEPERFVRAIGDGDYALHDRAIAKRLGIKVGFLSRAQVFTHKPEWQATYKANLHAYHAMMSGLRRGKPLDAARADGLRAAHRMRVGPPKPVPPPKR